MIPFSLKAVCFALSLLGLISCWMILVPFAMSVRSFWGPLTFCFGVTLLEGAFCLGMIWQMNPFAMPHKFCVAQTLIIGFASFLLSAATATFTFSTSRSVLNTDKWANSHEALRWKKHYFIPMVAFPILGSIVQTVTVIKFDAVKPSDNILCDASDPIWVRFLGYAGVPVILTIPCMVLSVLCIMKIRNVQKYLREVTMPEVSKLSSAAYRTRTHLTPVREESTELPWVDDEPIQRVPDLAQSFRPATVSFEFQPRPSSSVPSLAPSIRRIIFFQLLFSAITILATVSTFIDVVTNRVTPTPFGTQHVALILTGFGPLILYGELPM
ncbi:hypothetical protein C8J56DRAFT_831025 [Mycena floridula]|nr:hypothetical protein C8J56DRAFT_831025 [Mycena floridula]